VTQRLTGESAGMLSNLFSMAPSASHTLSHGYGLSVTPLQLANAYALSAPGGVKRTHFRRDAFPGRCPESK